MKCFGPILRRSVAILLVVPVLSGQIPAQDREPPADPQDSSLDLKYIDLIRRALEETRDALKTAEPNIGADVLRGRLLIEARDLINNITNAGLEPDRLLLLPEPLKEEATRLVDLVLGAPAPSGPTTPAEASAVPIRLRPYEGILAELLVEKLDQIRESKAENPLELLEAHAIELAAKTVSASNDPDVLNAEERSYAASLARQVARGERGAEDGAIDRAMQDDLDALAELIRQKHTGLKLSGELPGIGDRIEFLDQFGVDRMREALEQRAPEATIPEPARRQIRAIAELTAREVPFAIPPDDADPPAEEPEPLIDDPEPIPETPDPTIPPVHPEPTGPEIDPEVDAIDPALLSRIGSLALAVDRGLLTAGIVDLPTRRAALRKFVREHAARKTNRGVDELLAELIVLLDQLVEEVLAEHAGIGGPPPPVVVVPPTVITVPPVVTVPPVPVLIPDRRHGWCPPWHR